MVGPLFVLRQAGASISVVPTGTRGFGFFRERGHSSSPFCGKIDSWFLGFGLVERWLAG